MSSPYADLAENARLAAEKANIEATAWLEKHPDASARQVPCTIRCWRIGQGVEVEVGQPCPECGRPHRASSRYDIIAEDDSE